MDKPADQAIADAIRAVAVANGMGWVIVAQLLEERGVTDRETFGNLLSRAATILDNGGPDDDPAKWQDGAIMLRLAVDHLHRDLRKANPPPPPDLRVV